MFEQLKAQLLNALAILKSLSNKPMPKETTNGQKIYETAKGLIGKDASPNDVAPDRLGCAETVWNIVRDATDIKIGGELITSTRVLYQMLLSSPSFESVTEDEAGPGDIGIAPTGYSTLGPTAHGHCWIVLKFGCASNDSETGLLEENYTKESARVYFGEYRGFPICYFRMRD